MQKGNRLKALIDNLLYSSSPFHIPRVFIILNSRSLLFGKVVSIVKFYALRKHPVNFYLTSITPRHIGLPIPFWRCPK